MIELITKELAIKYFQFIKEHILKHENRKSMLLTREWSKTFPIEAGVYCIFEDNVLKYVGESGSIRGRMTDLLNTKNHNFRRILGNLKYSSHIGYEKATSYKSFIPEIESGLQDWITNHCKVSYLTVHIGRKEFEDWLQDELYDIVLLNKRKRRG